MWIHVDQIVADDAERPAKRQAHQAVAPQDRIGVLADLKTSDVDVNRSDQLIPGSLHVHPPLLAPLLT